MIIRNGRVGEAENSIPAVEDEDTLGFGMDMAALAGCEEVGELRLDERCILRVVTDKAGVDARDNLWCIVRGATRVDIAIGEGSTE